MILEITRKSGDRDTPVEILAKEGDWSISREAKEHNVIYISHHNCTEHYFYSKNTNEYIAFNDDIDVIKNDYCDSCKEKIPEKMLFLYKLLQF